MGEYFPCSQNSDCPIKGCPTEDEHHLFWPGNEYQGTLEKTFRNLPDNKVDICRRLHEWIHKVEPIPEKPDHEQMRKTIIEADMAGQICLSAAKRRVVYGQS